MPIKNLIIALIVTSLSNSLYAHPPFQILQTCINDKPYNENITLIEIGEEGATNNPITGCDEQYEFIYDNHAYGTLFCNNKFYVIINDKKIDPELADNMSVNPEIVPGVPFTQRAIWYKINYGNKDWLCILAPLSEQGIGSAHNQYYIIENAFNHDLTPQLYYYFLDENIAPITSKNL